MATTQNLEDVLRHVESLTKDLSAEIILQEEKSHTELVEKASLAGNIWDEWTENEKIIDQPRIAHPDTEKRESAKQQLQQIYDSNEWFFIRYSAQRALGAKSKELDKLMYLQLEEFEENLKSVNFLGSWDSKSKSLKMYNRMMGGKIVKKLDNGKQSFCLRFADSLTRIKAVKELGELFKLSNSLVIKKSLKKAYKNDYYFARKLAAEYLGYSKSRFIAHELRALAYEEPLIATGCLITAAGITGAASSLGYMIYQYMTK